MRKYLAEPYRLFFPLGFILGFWGVLLWFLFIVFGMPYPAVTHSYIMIGGFLTAFTTGFLMTAVPRFTGTFHAEIYEVGISFISLMVLLLFSSTSIEIKSFCLIIGHLNLIVFFLRRFFRKKAALPLLFLFVPLSLLASVVGNTLVVLNLHDLGSSELLALGRSLAFTTMMLGLVLGIGSRLVPMFLGAGIPTLMKNHWIFLLVINFFASFVVQSFWNVQIGLLMRLLSIAAVAFGVWRIHKKPLNPSKLSYGLWFSCWGLVIGTAGGLFMPEYLIHWTHLVYITGFGLMTLMIGSRVILSHGGFDVFKEVEHFHFNIILFCILMAGVMRLCLFYHMEWMGPLLVLSSSLWLSSFIFWWVRVGSKLF